MVADVIAGLRQGLRASHHHCGGDLVREGLAAFVPQRPEEAQVARQRIEDVDQPADDGLAEADRGARVGALQPDPESPFSGALPAGVQAAKRSWI